LEEKQVVEEEKEFPQDNPKIETEVEGNLTLAPSNLEENNRLDNVPSSEQLPQTVRSRVE